MDILVAQQDIAFQNAIWLREQKQNELNTNKQNIYDINPYSDVDVLVKSILGM